VLRRDGRAQFSPSGGVWSAGGSLGAGSSGAGGFDDPLSAPWSFCELSGGGSGFAGGCGGAGGGVAAAWPDAGADAGGVALWPAGGWTCPGGAGGGADIGGLTRPKAPRRELSLRPGPSGPPMTPLLLLKRDPIPRAPACAPY
jgi:hypothetical protein